MTQESLSRLQTFYGHLDAIELLRIIVKDEFAGRVALLSSFGADAALLIALVAEIDPNTPILFLDTDKHFPETIEYVNELTAQLNLQNVKYLTPDPQLIQNIDKNGELWKHQVNRCCWLRKVEPLERKLKAGNYSALITGRKGFQTTDRASLPTIELDEDSIFRINPLIKWTKEQLKEEFNRRNLPQHPLVGKGYLSIGCAPCTRPVKEGEDERAGRWTHTAEMPGEDQKTECGIHLPENVTVDWSV